MSDVLPPGNVRWPSPDDQASELADILQAETWPDMWPSQIHPYATTAARDADLAGLGPNDRALAWVTALGCVTVWHGSAWHAIGMTQCYSSTTGAAPVTVVDNVNGTVLQGLSIPAVPYARMLTVSAIAYVSSTQTADAWETVLTYDSMNVGVNVLGRFRMTLNGASSAGSGVIPPTKLALSANATTALRVWVRRVGGIGTATGSADHTYCNIQAEAHSI